MVKYINRRNTDAFKWDKLDRDFSKDNLLPFWVADMDFETPDCIKEALHKYVEYPLGYFRTPDLYFDAFIAWEKNYHNYAVKKEWLEYAPGIVSAITWVISSFTSSEEAVIVQTPVFSSFIEASKRAKRRCIQSDLVYKNNRYEIDFKKFEKDIIDNNASLFILCNPANPAGRVWTKGELKMMLDICKKHHVFVISDEIHQDFKDPSLPYNVTAAATVGDYDDMLITMTSASKTFNLGGVQNAFIIIPDENNRKRFVDYRDSLFVDDGNGFGYIATMAAFAYGREWSVEVNELIYQNRDLLFSMLKDTHIGLTKLEGTYLAWLDFSSYFKNEEELKDFFENKCNMAISYGQEFVDRYQTFARINLATSKENIIEAANRILNNLN